MKIAPQLKLRLMIETLILSISLSASFAFATLDLLQTEDRGGTLQKGKNPDGLRQALAQLRPSATGKSTEAFVLSQISNGTSTVVATKTQTFSNSAASCNLTASCALSGVQFVEYKKAFRFGGEPEKLTTHFTDTRFVIKTARISDLESFGVVQFIRGCMFRTRLVNGQPVKELSISRNEFGNTVPFQHKGWEIDNDNDDPLISAETGYGRFALLRWNKDEKNITTDNATYYAKAQPPHSTVFLSDMPSGGALMPSLDVADNSTLEFRTCIFKIQDLPVKTDVRGSNIDSSKALFCAHWTHNYVFNFTTGKMDEPKSADAICETSTN